MPIIPAPRRLRQKDHKFKASLGYIVVSSRLHELHSQTLSQKNQEQKHAKKLK
jgi:hypothetical protein